jgi:GntR family transcriptional repressor for pyruvate dehydrogenase complex
MAREAVSKAASGGTVVEHATEQIAFRIASGIYPPGARLPSVRNLAQEFKINPSTVQVVLAHLQTAGFVEAHQRLGVVVRDVQLLGGIETWRFLFRFSQQLPDLAVRMLKDILATRLMLVASACREIATDPRRFDPTAVRRAINQLELLVASNPDDMSHVARAELHVVRTIIVTADQGLAVAVLNSVGEMLIEVPDVLRTMYADPELHVTFWKAFLAAWESGKVTERGIAAIELAIRKRDANTITRFRASITREATRSNRTRR